MSESKVFSETLDENSSLSSSDSSAQMASTIDCVSDSLSLLGMDDEGVWEDLELLKRVRTIE